MRRSLLLSSLALVLASGAPTAAADGARERPWPDHWPIVLPPIAGPLPPPPPPAAPTPPATPAGQRVLDVLERVRANLRSTRYQHRRVVREADGVYHWDCSLMTHWVLERAHPRAVAPMRGTRPLAEHFVRVIERAPVGRFAGGWQRVPRVADARPGDVFAWRRPRGFPSRNTGHVGVVAGAPRPVPRMPGAYAVRVVDATSWGHQDDTRPPDGVGGFGAGTLVFLTDAEGRGTHYGWYGTASGGYVVTPIVLGRVGP